MNRRRNITEARSLLVDIELGEEGLEAKRWRVAELAAEAIADGMSRREYAVAVGKHLSTVARWVLVWERWGVARGQRPRFADAYATIQANSDEIVTKSEDNRRYVERQVPTRHEDRVEMAAKLLDDPEVAKAVAPTIAESKTLASRLISQEVLTQDAQMRRKHREQTKQAREDGAMPLPVYMASMVVKISEFSLGLAALVDDLDELPEGRGREMVAEAIDGLIMQATRWAEKLEPKKPELRVVEGRFVREEAAS